MAHHAHDHDFHIPAGSIWPPVTCLGAGIMAFSFILQHHYDALIGSVGLGLGLAVLLLGMFKWFGILIRESRERGFGQVPRVLELANRYGMIFFIASEVMFFAAFFAAFFALRSFNPTWPPENIELLPLDLPVINTLLLLTSGATITWAHYALYHHDRKTLKNATLLTVILGIVFLFCQGFEYHHATYAFHDGVYGSLFYMLTGFHGFHVLVGTAMLFALYLRLRKGDFTVKQHFYFEGAAWYWHFVDVVWVGLFLFVYLI